jgi:tetratricopeptide (TPR) repeat protein
LTLKQELSNAEDARLAGNYNDAIKKYNEIVSVDSEQSDTYCHSLRGLAEVHRMLESYPEAEIFYSKALNAYKKSNNSYGLGISYLGLGQLHRQKNNLSDAKEVIKKAIIEFKTAGDNYGLADSNIELGHLELAHLNNETSLSYFQTAKSHYGELKDEWGLAAANLGIGKAYSKQNQFEDAKTSLQDALKNYQNSADKLGQANVFKELANIDLNEGNSSSAKDLYKKAKHLFEEMNESSEIKKINSKLLMI